MTYKDAQIISGEDGTYGIRVLATIETLEADEIGFVFSKSELTPTKENAKEAATAKVYKAIITSDNAQITAVDLGGTYIIACTITGIPEGDINIPLYVRAFSTIGTETKYTKAVKITANEMLKE